MPPHNKCGHTPTGLCGGIHFSKKMCTHVGDVLGLVRCEKRNKIIGQGTSLVAQWLRIRFTMQGTRVRALVWEDPTCLGGTKPVSHNY